MTWVVNDDQLRETLSAAFDARRAGRDEEAARLFQLVLRSGIEHPLALNALGMAALARHDFTVAADLFARAIAVDPAAPELRMNLARAHRGRGDEEAERAALDAALAIDQRHFMALVRLAEWHERHDDLANAAERWGHVLAMAPGLSQRPPAIDAMLDHARAAVERQHAAFAARIDGALASAHVGLDAADRRRIDVCIDHVLGRRRIYANECAGMHFPFLPADEFFERRHFPWIEQLEAQTATIRDEFLRVLAEDGSAIQPYVSMKPGTPQNKWSPLNGSLAWGAMHLWKDGRRDEAVCTRVPRTAAAVAALPLSDLPGQTPTVFFSILQPGAHLPAHTGVSNVRSIVHLPLIVPPGCGFRVGGETRSWQEGCAWVFDDTIEHEAWNRSDRLRAILILDVWNPHITPVERDMLRTFFAASAGATDAPADRLQIGD
jgi:aspartyl/asparaginyl beta-hydroxylase (cupin superfamily)